MKNRRTPSAASKPSTPVKLALQPNSPLLSQVKDGLGAIQSTHRRHIDQELREHFVDSIDTDRALQKGREQEHRWDYLIGHGPTKKVFGLEPHSAENSEISTVISKLAAARIQLREHLRDGVNVAEWFWVASGEVQFAPLEKATLRLNQSGIKFVGRKVMAKHIK
ncbi:hypothetical protein HB662_06195 [Roseomonas frigidaquae]|uniref:Uncharacterized protein n=1 Tax=Falsiroseomonas frigidaquae TaxID=487318 RepID=A0ABX1EWG4_9PROT|nr:hypothetical protein [Falsiroseomonas frigidaquae]NKE44360.1 hypothetical protein [Falsiroseomonas frigidaquae]